MIFDRPPYWMAPLLRAILYIKYWKINIFHSFSNISEEIKSTLKCMALKRMCILEEVCDGRKLFNNILKLFCTDL